MCVLHFPVDPNCEISKMTKTTGARCDRRPEMCKDGMVPRKIGDLVTGDHKVPIRNSESRSQHRYAVVVQDFSSYLILNYPTGKQSASDTEKTLQQFTDRIYIDNSMESFRVCENLNWYHDTATRYRSATNGIAQRAVRRVTEGTASVLMQSGLTDAWRSDAMKCHSF